MYFTWPLIVTLLRVGGLASGRLALSMARLAETLQTTSKKNGKRCWCNLGSKAIIYYKGTLVWLNSLLTQSLITIQRNVPIALLCGKHIFIPNISVIATQLLSISEMIKYVIFFLWNSGPVVLHIAYR